MNDIGVFIFTFVYLWWSEYHEIILKFPDSNPTVPGMCYIFGNGHFSTFDNKGYNFYGTCQYKVIYDKNPESDFSVVLEQDPDCNINAPCKRSLIIQVDHQTVYLRPKVSNEFYVAIKKNGVEKRINLPHTSSPSITVVSS